MKPCGDLNYYFVKPINNFKGATNPTYSYDKYEW